MVSRITLDIAMEKNLNFAGSIPHQMELNFLSSLNTLWQKGWMVITDSVPVDDDELNIMFWTYVVFECFAMKMLNGLFAEGTDVPVKLQNKHIVVYHHCK